MLATARRGNCSPLAALLADDDRRCLLELEVGIAQAELAYDLPAPGVHRAPGRDREVVVGPHSNVDDGVVRVRERHLHRLGEEVGVLPVLEGRVVVGEAQTALIRQTAGEDTAVGGEEKCVQVATGDLSDSRAVEFGLAEANDPFRCVNLLVDVHV